MQRYYAHPDSQRRKSLAVYRSVQRNDGALIWTHLSLVSLGGFNSKGVSLMGAG